MFKQYDPLKGEMLRIMDKDGKITNKEMMPELDDQQIVDAYKLIHYSRMVDLKAVSYQRQGRMYTYPPNLGQEAAAVGVSTVMRDIDWLVPAYRELGAYLTKGATPKDIYLYWGGHEDGSRFPGAPNLLPIAVPIATQLLHAVGIAHGLKYQEKEGVVFTFIGDGGTSEGDFHEAMNFAAVWKVPVVFLCQNNQYAISLPTKKQTAVECIAVKAVAYGMPGIRVDGNDFFSCYAAAKQAHEYAQSGNGPVFIEALTYRRGAHTTADDPTRYRTKEEEQAWEDKDPALRLKKYLIDKKLWTEEQESELLERYNKEVEAQFLEFESYPKYKLEDVFQYMYTKMPSHLAKQKQTYEDFLAWKESQ